jgi:predicted nuclease with TOPRIM domain
MLIEIVVATLVGGAVGAIITSAVLVKRIEKAEENLMLTAEHLKKVKKENSHLRRRAVDYDIANLKIKKLRLKIRKLRDKIKGLEKGRCTSIWEDDKKELDHREKFPSPAIKSISNRYICDDD